MNTCSRWISTLSLFCLFLISHLPSYMLKKNTDNGKRRSDFLPSALNCVPWMEVLRKNNQVDTRAFTFTASNKYYSCFNGLGVSTIDFSNIPQRGSLIFKADFHQRSIRRTELNWIGIERWYIPCRTTDSHGFIYDWSVPRIERWRVSRISMKIRCDTITPPGHISTSHFTLVFNKRARESPRSARSKCKG